MVADITAVFVLVLGLVWMTDFYPQTTLFLADFDYSLGTNYMALELK